MTPDLFADDIRCDPYPLYRMLRTCNPIHWNELAGAWVVVRYEDAFTILRHPAVAHWGFNREAALTQNGFEGALARWLELMDPRNSTRVRNLVADLFVPAMLRQTRQYLETVASRLLDGEVRQQRIDVIRDFAEPFTLMAAARLFGVPEGCRETFGRVSQGLGAMLFSGMAGQTFLTSDLGESAERFGTFIVDMIREKYKTPGRDLISALLRARDEGDEFGDEDIVPFLAFFLFASHDNMVNFIGNSIRVLMERPYDAQLLRGRPIIISSALEELLRFDSPVQYLMVRMLADVEVSATQIHQGDPVLVCIGSANRDPDQFDEPEQLNLERAPNRHLSFGHGPLSCIGASFARLEGQVAVNAFVQHVLKTPEITSLVWKRSPPVLRGHEELVLSF